MRFHLITDSADAATGLRLAGVRSTVVSEPEELAKALADAKADPGVGVVLITQGLYDRSSAQVDDFKRENNMPLVTEIPESGADYKTDAIARYVQAAIGVG